LETNADFGITNADNDNGRIIRVLYSPVNGDGLVISDIREATREEVIQMLSGANPPSIYTYTKLGSRLALGSEVKKVNVAAEPYLRTDASARAEDDLGNLPPCDASWL
jgi:hypothetical protein